MTECVMCPECWSSNVTLMTVGFTYHEYHCNVCDADFKEYSTPNKENNMKCEEVDHPKHYQNGLKTEVECIMFTRNLSFDLGNAFKYIWRAGNKLTASMDTDLAKALWYLKDAAEHQEYENSLYNPQTANFVHFLPKNELLEWKYNILSCILQNNIMTAINLLTNGL